MTGNGEWTRNDGGVTLRLVRGENYPEPTTQKPAGEQGDMAALALDLGAPTVASTIDRWLHERYRAGEITARTRTLLEARFSQLREMYGPLPITVLDRGAIRAWARRVGSLAPASRRSYQSTLHCFCRWAVEEGLLTEDPTKHLPRVREPRRAPRARPAQEVGAIFKACRNQRDRAIVALMVQMGLRSVEVSRLQLADWDSVGGTLLVRGKAGNERVLPVTTRTAEELYKYRAALSGSGGPLICDLSTGHHPLTPAAVAQIVSRIMRRAGVKQRGGDGVTPHTLRHTAASDVLDQCGNVRTVKDMLGHTSLATTQIYLRRASLDQLRDAMEGRDYTRPPLPPAS